MTSIPPLRGARQRACRAIAYAHAVSLGSTRCRYGVTSGARSSASAGGRSREAKLDLCGLLGARGYCRGEEVRRWVVAFAQNRAGGGHDIWKHGRIAVQLDRMLADGKRDGGVEGSVIAERADALFAEADEFAGVAEEADARLANRHDDVICAAIGDSLGEGATSGKHSALPGEVIVDV